LALSTEIEFFDPFCRVLRLKREALRDFSDGLSARL
jgi:hypothetical protein